MTPRHTLDILFLTNFSDYCFRSIPAMAQMADSLSVRLTLMHVYDPVETGRAQAERQLQSFFPEADRYLSCRRMVMAGPLGDAVKRHIELWPVNLVVAPAAGPMGLPRIGRRSARAQLIEECGVPLWTIGAKADLDALLRPVKNVACWLDFYSGRFSHLAFAIDYATKLNAELHLLHTLPVVDDGILHTMADGEERALHPQRVREDIERLCERARIRPHIHVIAGEGRSVFASMVKNCQADAVFVGNPEPAWRKWLGWGPHLADAVRCPTVYLGERLSVPAWNLETIEQVQPVQATRPEVALAP